MLNYQRVHHPTFFFVIRKSQTLVGMVDDWVDEIGFTKLPSGKRLHNYGKSPFLTVS